MAQLFYCKGLLVIASPKKSNFLNQKEYKLFLNKWLTYFSNQFLKHVIINAA